MTTIGNAGRLLKRAILANLATSKEGLAITPLLSGKHGIGKSQIVRSVAQDIGGVCITVDGGTLKEGEITGLPYQYRDDDGTTRFRFLPYYAVERIQAQEKALYEQSHGQERKANILLGDENRYSQNALPPEEKIGKLLRREVTPVIVFFDEINRTENTVYKELMNILLTKSVNGYRFPWWVFFVGAMNPSTQNSLYATNEMDPAQLDRFLKIKVVESASEWVRYGEGAGISPSILRFINDNPNSLSEQARELEDEEKPQPSPRGWEMVDLLLSGEPALRPFFTQEENEPATVEKDLKELVASKLGASVATMYFASLAEAEHPISPEELFEDDEDLSAIGPRILRLSAAKKVQTCDALLVYLKENIEFLMLDKAGYGKRKRQLGAFIKQLDASTRLLFAQKISSTTTDDGNPLITFLFDVFEQDLISMLDLSDETRRQIEAS